MFSFPLSRENYRSPSYSFVGLNLLLCMRQINHSASCFMIFIAFSVAHPKGISFWMASCTSFNQVRCKEDIHSLIDIDNCESLLTYMFGGVISVYFCLLILYFCVHFSNVLRCYCATVLSTICILRKPPVRYRYYLYDIDYS